MNSFNVAYLILCFYLSIYLYNSRHRPDLLNFDELNKDNAAHNLRLAFDIAEEHLGIAKLLDVEDMTDTPRPDEVIS